MSFQKFLDTLALAGIEVHVHTAHPSKPRVRRELRTFAFHINEKGRVQPAVDSGSFEDLQARYPGIDFLFGMYYTFPREYSCLNIDWQWAWAHCMDSLECDTLWVCNPTPIPVK